MARRSRRNFTAAEKAAIVRRHLIDKVPISDLCDRRVFASADADLRMAEAVV